MIKHNKEKEIVLSKKENLPVYKIDGYLLHSKYDPIKEAEQFVERHYKQYHLHVLFGFGNGYIVDKFLQKVSENDHLLVIDPIHLNFDTELVNTVNMDVYIGKRLDEVENCLRRLIIKYPNRIQYVVSPNYDKIFPEDHLELVQKTTELIKIESVNINTINYFSHDWQKNYLDNLFHAFQDSGIDHFEGKYNIPVIITSSGPSLTKQLPLLKKIKDKALIICAGSTINTLLSFDILPDIVVTVDGGINNYKHFKDLNLQDVMMVYSLLVHHQIVDEHKGSKAFFIPNSSKEIIKLTEEILNKKIPFTYTGASVANFSLFIAHKISKGPICLIGQDLAYTNNKTHSENNRGAHEITEDYIKKRNMFYTDGYYADQVLTDYAFFSMKKTFEDFSNLVNDSERLFNCTEGGIKINGYQQIPFNEFVKMYVDNSNEIFIKEDLNKYNKRSIEDWETFLKKIEHELKQYKMAKENSLNALLLLKKNRSKEYFEQKIIKQLNKYDQKLQEQLKSGLMYYLTQPIVHQILNNFLPKENESQKDIFTRVYNRSKKMYESLVISTEETISHLQVLREKIMKKIK